MRAPPPRIAEFAREAGEPGGGPSGGAITPEMLVSVAPEARAALLAAWIRTELGRGLGLDAGEIDPERPFSDLGLDSLVGWELKGKLEAALRISLPLDALSGRSTVNGIAAALVREPQA